MAVQAKDTGDKTRAVENAVAQIEKMYGKGSIMRLGDRTPVMDIPVLSTGSIALDAALGVGGVPCGRIIEVLGPESSVKTTLAYHIVANAQKDGGTAAFIDAEHSVDPEYAKNVGVDVDSLLLSQPDSGEQALEITEMLVRSGALAVVVVDSVAALVPKAELEGEMGDSHMGLQARLMSQAMRKLTGVVSKTGTCLIFINQIRQKIGVMFGSPETTTGGRALKFYTSVRLDIRRIGAIKEGDKFIGNRTKVKVVKNKVSSPFRVAEFDILYGEGISREGDLIELGVEHKIIDKSGSWFSYGDLRIGQGRENARLFLRENTDVAATIENLLREKLGLSRPAAEKSADSTSTAADTAAAPPKAAVQDKAAGASDQASPVALARGRGRVRAGA
ncbi:MAG: recombinase RecA [Acidobacteria bacterium]|nr:recombinase RecA [Acidobacteriota bacterium]